jgi:putative PIN family toxin of toxin-antitoxin system
VSATAPRVVFDTNILFSAVGWLGAPHRCVQIARRGDCESISCREILDDLREKLVKKQKMALQKAEQTVGEIETFSQLVQVRGDIKFVDADPDDDVILDCAISGSAEIIVSGDHHLLDLKEFRGVAIIDANSFLKLVEVR